MIRTLIVCLAIMPITTNAADSDPDGFRGLKWGESITAHKSEMVLSSKSKSDAMYRRRKEKLSIGAADLKSIDYVFYKDRLMGITAHSAGEANKSALIKTFQQQFGNPEQDNQFIERYVWWGIKTKIIVDCDVIGSGCSAIMLSREINDARDADELAAAKSAGKDF